MILQLSFLTASLVRDDDAVRSAPGGIYCGTVSGRNHFEFSSGYDSSCIVLS